MKEIWKKFANGYSWVSGNGAVKDAEPIYISNMGNIRGRNIGISRGYCTFRYKGKTYKLHQEVAKLFIPNPDNKPTVDHINRVRSDCRVSNLRWATYSEQAKNKDHIWHIENFINPKKRITKCVETGELFESVTIASKHIGLKNESSIARACRTGSLSGGYHWEYIYE